MHVGSVWKTSCGKMKVFHSECGHIWCDYFPWILSNAFYLFYNNDKNNDNIVNVVCFTKYLYLLGESVYEERFWICQELANVTCETVNSSENWIILHNSSLIGYVSCIQNQNRRSMPT